MVRRQAKELSGMRNTGERTVVKKYCEGKIKKDIPNRVKQCLLEIAATEADGALASPRIQFWEATP
jgi:hypothetical protein